MANFQKTQHLFNGEPPGLEYEKSAEHHSEEKWFEQMKDPVIGGFFQLEVLREAREVSALTFKR